MLSAISQQVGSLFRSSSSSDEPTNPLFLNETAWFNILLHCDKETLLNANLTCHAVGDIFRLPKFWIAKMKCDGVGHKLPPGVWLQHSHHNGTVPAEFLATTDPNTPSNSTNATVACTFNFKRLYLAKGGYGRFKPYTLKPDMTLEILERDHHCRFPEKNGHGISIESPPLYCESNEEAGTNVCFITSFGWGSRYIELDLLKWGIEPWILDYVRPRISVYELANCRGDCGAEYELHVQLLKENEVFEPNTRLATRFGKFTQRWEQWEGGKEWTEASLSFANYSAGIRRIGILTRGKDTQFWAGYYGSKFTMTEIEVLLPNQLIFHSVSDFPDPKKEPSDDEVVHFNNPRPFSLRGPLGMRRGGNRRRGGFNPWNN